MSTKTLRFKFNWIKREQRNYYSPFARKLNAILDRFPFGISWDINPPDGLEVEISNHIDDAQIEIVRKRVSKFLIRQSAAGVIGIVL